MNILLISQCDKRALTETRRILDQFAERRGDRTWQTPITQAGLDTLHRLLRKTARKNTAVACHWIRGIDHSEILWVVGDRRRFNDQGTVPTNTTQRNVLRQQDENNWHTGELIRLLADMAGLLHDLGKAIKAFQMRLQGNLMGHNLVRHEWVSLRLFEAFVGSDDDATWLARLVTPTLVDDARWLEQLRRDGLDGTQDSPFKTLKNAPLAQALAWLVVTHHRLPELPPDAVFQMSALPGLLTQLQPTWNERAFSDTDRDALKPYWDFPQGLPVTTEAWRQRASRIAHHLLGTAQRTSGNLSPDHPLNNPFVMHLSRLSLMLADHHYSSLEGANNPERVKVTPGNQLLANTCRKDGSPNQPLDEHLVGVAQHGAEVARFLPKFEQHLPRLGRHKRLKQRSLDERFRWQDKSADVAAAMRERSQKHGAFIVNMASTGCGKTLANARIMYALADPATGMRCAFALGLRTLTLQTGKAFRKLLGLTDDDLAIRVGGSASRVLFEHYEAQAEATGSASQQSLLDEDTHVLFDGQADQHPLLRRAVADPQVRALLLAPVLVCTIDHLTPATESQRGGRQIAPMLRLMSSDLVLDEPDDFDMADLPALTRLVHWAGLLGARVLLSSATLPPALVQGLFEAYRNGRHHFQRNCGVWPGGAEKPPAICCAWMDEFHQQSQDCPDAVSFERAHDQFAGRRHGELARLAVEPRRCAALRPLQGLQNVRKTDLPALADEFAPQVLSAALDLHRRQHCVDPYSGKRVSFGLVRMANIEPLFEVALALFRQGVSPGTRVHLCVYHSRHPLLVRSAIEAQLDAALQRHDSTAVFTLPDIRLRLDSVQEGDQLFIVLASPVSEVGRDHDYDWAVVEPSSMRSLIQLAGRVRRHRPGNVDAPNILVFNTNLRHFRQPGQAAFCKPGFETNDDAFHLASHDLQQLLRPEEYEVLDARPRIISPAVDTLQPRHRLVDLEHARMRNEMLVQLRAVSAPAPGGRARGLFGAFRATLNASTWWQQAPQDTLLTAVLPQQQPFRKEPFPRNVTLALLPDDDGENALLHQVMDGERRGRNLYVEVNQSQCEHLPDEAVQGQCIEPWGVTNYISALNALAVELDLSLPECAQRFGMVTVRPNDNGWRYHPALGFAQSR
ncbi:MAG: type I-F CRISPR-associated helicase Cas3 [Acidithiobacillus ferriphilus]|uniref:type I-F CRISPR-associated helicase Cas3f n=1 Tax=Acidithiobacillus ferriphilus TaxID=1689834 RepID=UPI002431618C|nr:type I-F CRISPR-associated helicase Cas3f [Acidithiobacillus ferriphilus]MBW9247734.1 type I-F CRISPR-associated helicase Cas3 [Acidithiobacillus ferriphilus]MBW9253781.1 type I-F CRISPR-associated helicase Cas3 [Acidithiobacillus ferriphilus]